jgi:3-keto-L-gulonate-6-phosphate decarboxylase
MGAFMKLQISFDFTDIEKAVDVAKQVADSCDILEIDTMLLQACGAQVVQAMRQTFEKKTLLVDTKLVDCAESIIPVVAQAGADWITVLAGSSANGIRAICKEAHKHNLKVLLDLIDACSKEQSAMEAKNLGAHALLFHHTYDTNSSPIFLDEWQMVRDNASLPIFISAHINRSNFEQIVSLKPHGIIVGKSITRAENPAEEAAYYFDITNKD